MKLTLLRNTTIRMYTVYVSLQALQLSSTLLTEVDRIRQACVSLPTPFSPIMIALTLLPLLNICTLPGCLYIWWFLWILLGNELAKMLCHGIAIVAKLFCLSTIPTQSGEPLCNDQGSADRKRVAYCAVANVLSNTFCERSTWILRFCDACLLGIVMSVQVSRFTAQFCKNTECLNLKAIQY